MTTEINSPLEKMSPAGVNAIYVQFIEAVHNANYERFGGIYAIVGTLGILPQVSWGKYYDVPLKGDDDTVTMLVIGEKLIKDKFSVGDFVVVHGRLSRNLRKGVLRIRLEVFEIFHAESLDVVGRQRRSSIQIDELKSLGRDRYPFPFGSRLRISLICSPASKGLDDFKKATASVSQEIDLSVIPVSMVRIEEIADAIRDAEGNVVVVLRGGGDDDDLKLFDAAEIVKAISLKKAFRIVAVGHESDRHLSDFMADYAASTPSDAGHFISRLVEDESRSRKEVRRLGDELSVAKRRLSDLLKQRDLAAGEKRALEVVRQQLDDLKESPLVGRAVSHKNTNSSRQAIWYGFALVLLIVAISVAGWFSYGNIAANGVEPAPQKVQQNPVPVTDSSASAVVPSVKPIPVRRAHRRVEMPVQAPTDLQDGMSDSRGERQGEAAQLR